MDPPLLSLLIVLYCLIHFSGFSSSQNIGVIILSIPERTTCRFYYCKPYISSLSIVSSELADYFFTTSYSFICYPRYYLFSEKFTQKAAQF